MMPAHRLHEDKDLIFTDRPEIWWVRVRDAIHLLWRDNPKQHDLGSVIQSYRAHGIQELPKFDSNLQNVGGVEGGAIKAGNGRIEALWRMEQAGNEDLVRGLAAEEQTGYWVMPVLIGVDAPNESLARAYAIDSNNLTMMGGTFTALEVARMWDMDKYLEQLKQLAEVDVMPVSVTAEDLDHLIAMQLELPGVGEPEPAWDRAAELKEKWQTDYGQLWEFQGALHKPHRLMCWDCTDEAGVRLLLDGVEPLVMVTDPPYGVEMDHVWRYKGGLHQKASPRSGSIEGDTRADWSEVYPHFNPQILYAWHGSMETAEVYNGLVEVGYPPRQAVIWSKTTFTVSRSHYHWAHEMCWYAIRKGENANWLGDRKQRTVWEFPSPTHSSQKAKGDDTVHPTQKPLEVYKIPMMNHTQQGDTICDPFAGSGTVFVAAEQMGRQAFGMELDPKFCAVILERMAEMGMEPILVETYEPEEDEDVTVRDG